MNTKNKVSIVTLGCAKNQVDTNNLARVLEARGYEVTSDPAQACAIVVHTCSFIEAAKKESIEAILHAGQIKSSGQQLIVTGCMVQQHGNEIFDELPEVDAFLGTGQLAQVPDLLDHPRKRFLDRANPGGFMDPHEPGSGFRRNDGQATAYLRLSEGCRHPCTFCVIPRLRGPVRSRQAATILREARDLVRHGVEELIVIAQDTGDWGRDLRTSAEFPELLRGIRQIPGVRWIRLMYMHPASFTDSILEVLAEEPEKIPYLDMPLQHIDSHVLAAMKRKGDEAGLRGLIERIRNKAPHLSLRTTFLVGFPGETDAEFSRLVGFVKEGHFDYLGAFAYSKEAGTPAARRRDQIPESVKQQRLAALTNAHYDVAHVKATERIGSTETVILDEIDGSDFLGRTSREAPEIDAIVRVPRQSLRAGGAGRKRFIRVEITGYDAYEFTARVC